MKPGKLGYMGVITALSAVIFINTFQLAEIPKLESRVDELTATIEAKDEAMETQYQVIQELTKQVQEATVQVETLQKRRENLLSEIKELKEKEEQRKKQVSRGGNYREVAVVGNAFEATWYNDYGHTKSGRFVKDNVTIAVDPRVIPLDSWVKIEFPDGTEMIRRADDTGGAVNGHIIDIYDNASTRTLLQRGRTHGVKVTIIKRL
jgi:3D (Asp-Asp-Asp) domain-containing protein